MLSSQGFSFNGNDLFHNELQPSEQASPLDKKHKGQQRHNLEASEQGVLNSATDNALSFRFLQRTDYQYGYPNSANSLAKQDFLHQFEKMFPRYQDLYKIVVVFDKLKNQIVGSGTLSIELKITKAYKVSEK